MESKEHIKSSMANNEFEWFLVQYDQNPQKLIRKIVKSKDLMWSDELQNGNERENVLIRDQEKLYLGFIICNTKNYQDAIEQHKFLQIISMQLLHTPLETNDIMDNLHFNHNFWILVMYSTVSVKEEQSIFAIYHKNDVILKKDIQSNNLTAYVQEKESTFKGVVVKITNDISDMIFMMNIIRNDLLKSFQVNTTIDHEKKNREINEEINHMEQRMYRESKLLLQAFQAVDKSKTRLLHRLIYLQHLADINNVRPEN